MPYLSASGLRWCFTTKRHYIKCMHLYVYLYLYLLSCRSLWRRLVCCNAIGRREYGHLSHSGLQCLLQFYVYYQNSSTSFTECWGKALAHFRCFLELNCLISESMKILRILYKPSSQKTEYFALFSCQKFSFLNRKCLSRF